jgi:hypothetical protein
MGNHDLGRQIGLAVQVVYERRNSQESALDILDRFCKGRGGDAEWEAEDPARPGYQHPEFIHYTDPHPSAGLGMLMVEAFAPNGLSDLPKYEGVLGYQPSDNAAIDRDRAAAADTSNELWRMEVYSPFNKRYGFW